MSLHLLPRFRFATFVLSLYQIIGELVFFLVVLCLFILMFANALLGESDRD